MIGGDGSVDMNNEIVARQNVCKLGMGDTSSEKSVRYRYDTNDF